MNENSGSSKGERQMKIVFQHCLLLFCIRKIRVLVMGEDSVSKLTSCIHEGLSIPD